MIFFLGVGTGFVLNREGPFIKSSEAEKGLAVVNGKAISWDQYHLYLHKAEEGKRNPLTEAEKRLVLQRMIEEELLFQKAKKLGLIEKDPQIRKTIISSMMDFIKTNPERTVLPTNEVLKSFFEKNKPEFRPISRIKVDHRIHLKSEDKSKSTSYTPKRLLPINSLLPYLGPSLTKVSLKLINPVFACALSESQFGAPISFVIISTKSWYLFSYSLIMFFNKSILSF